MKLKMFLIICMVVSIIAVIISLVYFPAKKLTLINSIFLVSCLSVMGVSTASLKNIKDKERKRVCMEREKAEAERRQIFKTFLMNIGSETTRMIHLFADGVSEHEDGKLYHFGSFSMKLDQFLKLSVRLLFLEKELELFTDLIFSSNPRDKKIVAWLIREDVQFLLSIAPIPFVPRCPNEVKIFLKDNLDEKLNENLFNEWLNK